MSNFFDFIKEDLNDANTEEFIKMLQGESNDQPPPASQSTEPTPSKKKKAIFNYDGNHFEEEFDKVTPETICHSFEIEKNFELQRKSVTYKVVGNGFDPPLVPGTFTVRILPQSRTRQQQKRESVDEQFASIHCNNHDVQKISINEIGHASFHKVSFMRNPNKWNSKYLIDDKGNVIELSEETSLEPNAHYYLVFNGEKDIQLKDPLIQPFAKTRQTSLENVNLANASVYYVLFSRSLLTLSKIKNDLFLDLEKEELKEFKALICGKSCKANLFQIASSINCLMTKLVDYILKYDQMTERPDKSINDFLEQLEKIGNETSDFIHVLSKHLKNTEPNENTVKIVMELDDLKRLDSETQKYLQKQRETASEIEEDDSFDMENPLVSRMKTNYVWSGPKDIKNFKAYFGIFTKQRNFLKEITSLVKDMVDMQTFEVTNLLKLLKFLKQLVLSTTKSFASFLVFWTAVGVIEREDLSEILHSETAKPFQISLKNIFLDFEKTLNIWKAVGYATPLALNFARPDDWETMQDQVFNAQYHAEIAYHQVIHSPENNVVFPTID